MKATSRRRYEAHNDPASLLGKASGRLTAGGKDYRIYPLTYDDLAELKVWVNERIPDPIEAVTGTAGFAKLSPEAQKYALRVAVELVTKGQRHLTSPEAAELLASPEGVMEMLYLMVRRGDPSFTREAAQALAKELTPADVARLHSAAYDVEPSEAAAIADRDGEEGDPKAEKGRGKNRTGGDSSTP